MASDFAHDETDDLLEELERRVSQVYAAALKSMRKKQKKALEEYDEQNAGWLQRVKDGEATAREYRAWRADRAAERVWIDTMAEQLAEDLENAEEIADSIANGYRAETYALNWNFAAFEAEALSGVSIATTIYSREAVERLIREEPDLLPELKRDEAKTKRWLKKKLVGAITQSILQGEGIPQAAMRIANVTDMDKNASVRAARTAMTSAENAGRIDAYKRAESVGVKMQKEWMATLDDRTRRSHRRLDGERVGVDEKFSNGLRYPGDPSGSAEEVYNCRCTIVASVEGVDQSAAKRRSRLGKKSYEQWKKELEDG